MVLVMLGSAVVAVIVGIVLVLGWYLWFRRHNRRKSIEVLHRIKNAFAGHAQIIGVRCASEIDTSGIIAKCLIIAGRSGRSSRPCSVVKVLSQRSVKSGR